MGYLHKGHTALVEAARNETDLVVMSAYVNPTQFGPNEDYSRYPRDLDRDRESAAAGGVDILFLPDSPTMYPGGADAQQVWVDPGPLAAHLCGRSRPGHFRGVTTVVTKLFHLVDPDKAYFGQKDAQQAIIIRAMVAQLAFPIEVRIAATLREPDGLALSSRNVLLTEDERRQAHALSSGLGAAKNAISEGNRDVEHLKRLIKECLARDAPSGNPDYVEIVDLATLEPLRGVLEQDALIALAVYFSATRLIDNVIVRFEKGVPSFS